MDKTLVKFHTTNLQEKGGEIDVVGERMKIVTGWNPGL